MTKKGIQEINFKSDQNGNFRPHSGRMPIVRCLCGCEILVVPDLKAMNVAIKNHVAEHKKTLDSSGRVLAVGLLTEFLTEQVLLVASEIDV